MRTTRIHLDQPLTPGARLALEAETSHYLGTVLRLRSEAPLLVFNARDGEYAAHIVSVTKHVVEVEVGALTRPPQASRLTLHLGLGISRGDRMDFAIQKSTELGVARITPVFTEFGEVRLKAERAENKLRHWRKVAGSAAEQSGRLDIPDVDAPQTLAEFNDALAKDNPRLLLDPSGECGLAGITVPHHDGLALLIGPEGGFAPQELAWARTNGFTVVSLGPRILRTETAPVAALAILQHRFGDM